MAMEANKGIHDTRQNLLFTFLSIRKDKNILLEKMISVVQNIN
jgi:hypothetical protein